MKIKNAIFAVDDSYFLEFWPIQAKLCKEILNIQPVLFYICDEDSDFYFDENGLVKKIKKVGNINTGLLACISRMYGTKYFQEEVCITCDLDMLMINKNYFIEQVKKFDEDSLVIYSSDAYDLKRPEARELFNTQPFPFTQEMYNYPYNAAKGKIFNKILNTDCSFEDFVLRHSTYKPGYHFMWMIDEFYFSDCVNNKNHGVEVHKLKRGYSSPWIADKRIDRHNFPVELEFENERENQKRLGIYDVKKLEEDYYIDVNCCRPYSKYKNEIDKLVNIVLSKNLIMKIEERTELCDIMDKHGSDKASKPSFVDYHGHNYTRYYHQILKDFRNKKSKIFEIGIGTNNTSIPYNMGKNGNPGASLRGWAEYFVDAEIYGADIDTNILFNEKKIKTFYCDQKSIQSIKELWNNLECKFDVIIDDGVHEFETNILFLENSIHKLKKEGYFIVEDVTSEDLKKWENILPDLEKKYSNFDIKIIKLEWTHADNNLIIFKKEVENTFYDLGKKYKTETMKIDMTNFDWGVMEGYDLKDILIRELFEEQIYNRHFPVNEGDLVVDVGASVGPFIWTIMDKKPKHVYAFEPSDVEYSTLVKNTRGWPVTTINKAMWNGDGITNVGDIYYTGSYFETMRFSTFRKLYAIDHINFLKTDCEGGEYEIFSDENIQFLVDHVDVIVGEWHLETPERKESFRNFRDQYLPRFKDVHIYSVDGADIKWDLYNEHFIQYYKQIIIHIDNRKLDI